MDIETWPLHALATLALIAAEASASILRQPILQSCEIRLLVAFGATDYLYERPGYFQRWTLGHVALVHEICQELGFVAPFQLGRIPVWSHFYQVWDPILKFLGFKVGYVVILLTNVLESKKYSLIPRLRFTPLLVALTLGIFYRLLTIGII